MGGWFWFVILGGIGVLLVLREAVKHFQSASSAHVAEVVEGFLRIQQAAFDNVVDPNDADAAPEAREARFMEEQYFVSSLQVGIGYGIVRTETGFVHRLMMHAEGPQVGRKRIAQLMLLLMGALLGELDMFDEAERPRFEIAELPDGTHQLTFELTDEQEATFREKAMTPVQNGS